MHLFIIIYSSISLTVSPLLFMIKIAVYGGLVDRVHDLLLCGLDPSQVDLSISPSILSQNDFLLFQETHALLQASIQWMPARHAFLFGPQFKACIASLCLVKVLLDEIPSKSLFQFNAPLAIFFIQSFLFQRCCELDCWLTHIYLSFH
jgi:hypothetical protein